MCATLCPWALNLPVTVTPTQGCWMATASTGTFLGTSKPSLVHLMSRCRHGDSAANSEKGLSAFLSSHLRASEAGTPSCSLEARGHSGQHIEAGSQLGARGSGPLAGPQGASLTWSTLSSWTPNLPPKPRTESTCEQCLERLDWYSWPTADWNKTQRQSVRRPPRCMSDLPPGEGLRGAPSLNTLNTRIGAGLLIPGGTRPGPVQAVTALPQPRAPRKPPENPGQVGLLT